MPLRARLVERVQVREVPVEPAVRVPEAAHGAQVVAPGVELERRDAGDPVARARALVRDRDPQRGERCRALLHHVPGGVEPPLARGRVARARLRLAEAPARRRDPVRGQKREELRVRGRARSVRAQVVELVDLRHVRLGHDVEGGEQVALHRRGSRQPHVEHADRDADRRRLAVGRHRDCRAVAAGAGVGRDEHLEVERLVRLLHRAGRSVPGQQRVGDRAPAERDEVAEVQLCLQRAERAAVDRGRDSVRVRRHEPRPLALADRRIEAQCRAAALRKATRGRDRLRGGIGEHAGPRGRREDEREQDHRQACEHRHLGSVSTL